MNTTLEGKIIVIGGITGGIGSKLAHAFQAQAPP
jgi:NADP-dependent 3-hydroxy acid dehydrogenase YdfG